jgi:hypothetical protein
MKTLIMLVPALAFMCGCAGLRQAPSVPSNHWRGSLDGQPFEFELPKQTTAENIEIESVRGNPFGTNYAHVKIGKISGTNSPDVIDAAAQLETARWNGINAALDKIGGIAEHVATGAAKGTIQGVK